MAAVPEPVSALERADERGLVRARLLSLPYSELALLRVLLSSEPRERTARVQRWLRAANAASKADEGRALWRLALKHRSVELVTELLEHADAAAFDERTGGGGGGGGQHCDDVTKLVRRLEERRTPSRRDWSSLQLACADGGDFAAVRALLRHGERPTANALLAALRVACRWRPQLRTVAALLLAGAPVPRDLYALTLRGSSALLAALLELFGASRAAGEAIWARWLHSQLDASQPPPMVRLDRLLREPIFAHDEEAAGASLPLREAALSQGARGVRALWARNGVPRECGRTTELMRACAEGGCFEAAHALLREMRPARAAAEVARTDAEGRGAFQLAWPLRGRLRTLALLLYYAPPPQVPPSDPPGHPQYELLLSAAYMRSAEQ